MNWGKSIERDTHQQELAANEVRLGLSLTEAIQRDARLGSEAAESVVSKRRAGETLPPKPYD